MQKITERESGGQIARDILCASRLFTSRRRTFLIVAALATAIATAGIATIPFYTRGEPREALLVREIVEGSGWVLPRRNGELHRKPPFFHWLGALAGLVAGGVDEATTRLPSAVAGVAAALMVLGWASRARDTLTGALAALIAATTFEAMRAATVARVDMVYAALLTAMLASLDRLLRSPPRAGAWRLAFYGSIAAATLTKGPVAIVLATITVVGVAWARPDLEPLKRLRPLAGLAVVGAIVGAWLLLAVREHGAAFLSMAVRENVHHLMQTDVGGTGHAHGALYLIGVGLLGFLPWTPLLPLIGPALRRWRDDPAVVVAAVWAAAVLGLHLVASAKRAVYLLPAHPALALLIAEGVRAVATPAGPLAPTPRARGLARAVGWTASGYALLVVTLGSSVLILAVAGEIPSFVAAVLSPRDRLGAAAVASAIGDRAFLFGLLSLSLFAAAPLLARAGRRTRLAELIVIVALVTGGVATTFNTLLHPALAEGRSLKRFMSDVSAIVDPSEPLAFLGSVEPAASFYARREIDSVPKRAPSLPRSYLLVWERDWRDLAADGRISDPIRVSRVSLPRRGHLLLVDHRTLRTLRTLRTPRIAVRGRSH